MYSEGMDDAKLSDATEAMEPPESILIPLLCDEPLLIEWEESEVIILFPDTLQVERTHLRIVREALTAQFPRLMNPSVHPGAEIPLDRPIRIKKKGGRCSTKGMQ